MKQNDENDLPSEALAAAAAAMPRVIYGFSCGAGSCKVFRVIDGVSRRLEHAELPAPEEDPQG